MSQRLIRVDDTDTSIQYIGAGQSWFQDRGSRDATGNFGPTYLHTSHGIQSNGSFSFPFQGNSVTVFGTNNRVNTTTGWDPRWECFVDNVSIGATDPFPYDENNWALCRTTDLNDGLHELSVNVTSTTGQPFWFDYIQYAPSSTVSQETAYVVVDSLDPALGYGVGWTALGGTANMTSTQGSIFQFNFTGIGLSWVSFIPTELPHNATSATYSIDGGSQVSFNLAGLSPTADTTVYNQVFFSTPELSAGPHTLLVIHGGTSQQTPLTLDYLIVTNTSVPATNSSPIPTSTNSIPAASSSPAASTSESGSPPIGAIVGGVVGGLAAIALALLFLFYRRRRKQASHILVSGGERSRPELTPFMTTQEAPGSQTVGMASHRDSLTSYPVSQPPSANFRPTHGYGPSTGQFSTSTSDNSWGAVPLSAGVVRKQAEHQPPAQVIHQDSGLRFHDQDGVVEVPPGYSPD